MTDKQINYLTGVISNEGFDYTFVHYAEFEEIEDAEFHKLRLEFLAARERLHDYLEAQGVDFEC